MRVIEQSKEIEDLKKEEEDFYNTFVEYKKVYSEINAKIKNQLGITHEVKAVVRKERAASKKAKEAEDKKKNLAEQIFEDTDGSEGNPRDVPVAGDGVPSNQEIPDPGGIFNFHSQSPPRSRAVRR